MTHPPMSETDLDELETFLDSDAVPERSLSLEGLHGLLTALAIGPAHVGVDEWLPRVWGEDEEPEFDSQAEANRIRELMIALGAEVRRSLDEGDDFAPVIYLTQEGRFEESTGFEWAGGFLEGISMREEAWRPLLDDEELSQMLAPVLAAADEQARPEQREAAFEDIPTCVYDLRDFWHTRPPAGARSH
jgi:uncharacterized protein